MFKQEGHLSSPFSIMDSEDGMNTGLAHLLTTTNRRSRSSVSLYLTWWILLGVTYWLKEFLPLSADIMAYSKNRNIFSHQLSLFLRTEQEQEHFLPSALFISKDTLPRSCIKSFLLHIIGQKKVSVISKPIPGREDRETSLTSSGR